VRLLELEVSSLSSDIGSLMPSRQGRLSIASTMYPNFYENVQSKFTSLLKDLERKKCEDETRCLDAFVMGERRNVAPALVVANRMCLLSLLTMVN
jgi:hypothetical protein